MLEFLVPSERKCFQWLIADGIMEERSCVGVNHTFPGKKSGSKQMENMAKKVLSRIVPALSRSIERTLLCPVFMPNYFTF